jgi:hypothetical protein
MGADMAGGAVHGEETRGGSGSKVNIDAIRWLQGLTWGPGSIWNCLKPVG